MAELSTNVRYIKGIGETRAKALEKLGITTLRDLINYFPRSYEDRTLTRPIRDLTEGENVCVRAMIAADPTAYRIPGGRTIVPAFHRPVQELLLSGLFPRAYALSIQTRFRDSPPPRRSAHPHLLRRPHPCGHGLASRQKNGFSDTGIPGIRKYYQLAFFTPGIRPFEAISRNWIRLMPNRRM